MANPKHTKEIIMSDSKSTTVTAQDQPLANLQGYELLLHLMRNDIARKRHLWGFPATGEYCGGCITGVAAARAYLKYLRENPVRFGCDLQHIALDMLGCPTDESVKGQAIGFFSEIDKVLTSCATLLTGLDEESFESLSEEMDRGLAWTSKAAARAERSRWAREAWQRREAAKVKS
jgi:hypothetical protein